MILLLNAEHPRVISQHSPMLSSVLEAQIVLERRGQPYPQTLMWGWSLWFLPAGVRVQPVSASLSLIRAPRIECATQTAGGKVKSGLTTCSSRASLPRILLLLQDFT